MNSRALIVAVDHLSMDRFGIFGGSFNPVHLGHLLVAQAAEEELGLTRLFFVPAAQSPFKPHQTLAPAEQRLRLLRLALAGRSHWEIDAQELDRGGVSFTIDTVRNYNQRFPQAEIFYLIGGDHVPQLPKWREAEELAQRCRFVVIPRPGEGANELPFPFRGCLLKGFPLGLSSSQIRQRLRQGKSIQNLVPAPVAEALENNHLYFS